MNRFLRRLGRAPRHLGTLRFPAPRKGRAATADEARSARSRRRPGGGAHPGRTGPATGSVEPRTVSGLMATLFETILALWLAATLILSRRPGRRVSVRVGTIGVSALVLTIATGATIALAAAPMG